MSIIDSLRDLIGDEATDRLCDEFGGMRIYVPTGQSVLDHDRIKHEFTDLLAAGSTCMNAYKTIATEYNVSSRTVQRIIAT